MATVSEQLRDLADLLERGLLTRQQFDEQRDRILAESRDVRGVHAPGVGSEVGPPVRTLRAEAAGVTESGRSDGRGPSNSAVLVAIGIGVVLLVGAALLVVALAAGVFAVAAFSPRDEVVVAPAPVVVSEGAGEEGVPTDAPARGVTDGRAGGGIAPALPAATYGDPLLDATAEARFDGYPDALADYRSAVDHVGNRNTRSAGPILDDLTAGAAGRAYAEEVALLNAAHQVNDNRPDEALDALSTWRRDHPDSRLVATAGVWEGKAHMAKALAAERDGDTAAAGRSDEAAEAALTAVVERFPDDGHTCGEALYLLSSLYGRTEQARRQREALDLLVTRYGEHPRAPRALYSGGNTAWANGAHADAEAYFQRVLDDYPDDRWAKRARRNLEALEVVGQPAPEIVASHWIGEASSLESQRGNLVLVVFWNEWCPHCTREVPEVQALWESYRDQGLSVVLVTKHTKAQTDEKVERWLTDQGVTIPCAVEADGYVTSKAYGISGVPAGALVDRDGTIVWRNHPARMTEERLQEFLGR